MGQFAILYFSPFEEINPFEFIFKIIKTTVNFRKELLDKICWNKWNKHYWPRRKLDFLEDGTRKVFSTLAVFSLKN